MFRFEISGFQLLCNHGAQGHDDIVLPSEVFSCKCCFTRGERCVYIYIYVQHFLLLINLDKGDLDK